MATDIKLTDLTNGSTVNGKWEGTGVFDVLLKTINENINIQYDLNRIKDTDYATVYLGSLQSAMQQSIEYLFKEQLTEAQVDSVLKDNSLKDAQLEERKNKEEAELEKQWGYDITRDTDGNLIMGNSTGNGIIDKQGIELDKNVDVKERSAVVQETESADKLLTTAEQRKLLEAQEKEAYVNRIIKDKEAVKAGLDNIHKTVSTTPEDVYTPKYETI